MNTFLLQVGKEASGKSCIGTSKANEMGEVIEDSPGEISFGEIRFHQVGRAKIRPAQVRMTKFCSGEFGTQEYSNLSPKLPEAIPEWSPIKYFGGYYNSK